MYTVNFCAKKDGCEIMREKFCKTPVIMYHSVRPSNPDWIWHHLITPLKVFENQIKYLSKKGFNTITLQELHGYMKHNRNLPKNPIILTFDDGYLDSWVYGYPILKKYRLKGTIFVSPDFVDPTEEYRPNLEDVWNGRYKEEDLIIKGFLSWREMQEMEKTGVIDIESHTMTHTWYFKDSEIVNFHHPGDNYVWLAWNAYPERKYKYMQENQKNFIEYGLPIYSHGRASGIRRYFEDKNLNQYLVDYVKSNGDTVFFNNDKWKEKLYKVSEEYKRSHKLEDRYETEEEFKRRVKYELAGSKRIIEEKLNKKAYFLCWPGGAYNEIAVKISREVGYLASTLSSIDQSNTRNTFGEESSKIKRIGCASAFYWHNRFISYTDPIFFMANIRYFEGSKIYLWITRLYKMKYLMRYTIKKLLRRQEIK